MNKLSPINVILLAAVLGACSKESPTAHSVDEFVENSILLEATMVRCAQDRSKMKYETDCVNAREAANRLAARDEEARRKELEAQFERKRRALRRTQDAAAEARRRAAEEQRRREEAEYLGIYDTLPAADSGGEAQPGSAVPQDAPAQSELEGNQPGVAITPPADDATPEPQPTGDIDSIREELKRRQENGGN